VPHSAESVLHSPERVPPRGGRRLGVRIGVRVAWSPAGRAPARRRSLVSLRALCARRLPPTEAACRSWRWHAACASARVRVRPAAAAPRPGTLGGAQGDRGRVQARPCDQSTPAPSRTLQRGCRRVVRTPLCRHSDFVINPPSIERTT